MFLKASAGDARCREADGLFSSQGNRRQAHCGTSAAGEERREEPGADEARNGLAGS